MNAPSRLADAPAPTRVLAALRRELRARAVWLAIFAAVGFVAAVAGPSPPPRSTEGIAAMLGAAVEGEVRPDDFVWEARGSFWTDAFVGRPVLFLARRRGQGQADLYRARVRLSRGGRALGLGAVRNLTESPLGDDRDLVASGHRAAYVTSAFGAVQGITLLDLDGDRAAAAPRGLVDRAVAAMDGWLSTGSARGIGRTEITFGTPPPEAREELQGDLLVMALGKEGLPAALGGADEGLNTGAVNAYEAVAARIPHATPPLGEVLVRAAREVVGERTAAGVAGIVGVVEGLRARTRSTRRAQPPSLPPASPVLPGDDTWPPAPLVPQVAPALPGEGAWTPGRVEVTEGVPPSVVETALRPDPSRAESWVRLYAMDTRQIDLRLIAGVEEPRSAVGLHGSGRLADPSIEARAVLSFAGGPAAKDGDAAGFIADRRVMASPLAGLATVALASDGRAELGVLRAAGPLPASVVSIRQTPDAIVGMTEPARWPLADATAAVERSALGVTRAGQLVYAWGADATASSLSRALELAGVTFAVPLATAPGRAGLAYVAQGDRAAPEMTLAASRLADRAPADRFVAVRRSSAPPPLASGTWAPDGGKQPSPAWLPAVLGASVVSLGAQVHLTSFAPGRFTFRMRPGAREPQTKAVGAVSGSLPEADQAKVFAAIGLAAGRKRGARGMVLDGAAVLPIKQDDAGALAFQGGKPRVLRASDVSHGFAGDAAELPLTADEGKLRPEARDVGTMRARAAACALEDGTFVIATTTFDSDEATTSALLDVGCARVVALDRGTHQAAFVDRAGVGQGPEPRYDATVVYALEAKLSGRAGPLSFGGAEARP